MKKYLIMFLIVVLCVSTAGYLCFASGNEAAPETSEADIAILEGAIVALESDRLTMRETNGSNIEYVVLLHENTIYEGKEILEVGDRISVQYNGMMTRSLPAQINADVISCHMMTGLVSDMAEGQFLLNLPDESQFLVVYDMEKFMGVQDGMTVTVYYNGASTRSIPPQITAEHIRTQGLTGVISGVTEGVEFILTDENGLDTIVHIAPFTFSFVELTEGEKVTVTTDGIATMSLPPQVNAVEILPAAE